MGYERRDIDSPPDDSRCISESSVSFFSLRPCHPRRAARRSQVSLPTACAPRVTIPECIWDQTTLSARLPVLMTMELPTCCGMESRLIFSAIRRCRKNSPAREWWSQAPLMQQERRFMSIRSPFQPAITDSLPEYPIAARRHGPSLSTRHDHQPACSNREKNGKEEKCNQQSKTISFALSEIAAPYEDDVLTPALGSNDRKVAAGKEQ